MASPVLGERRTAGRTSALILGVAGVTVLLGDNALPATLPGVACVLGHRAARLRHGRASPRGLPPLTATAWQVGLACLPMVAVGMLLKAPEPGALSSAGRAGDGLHGRCAELGAAAGRGVDGDPCWHTLRSALWPVAVALDELHGVMRRWR
jgi:hypothetical protein